MYVSLSVCVNYGFMRPRFRMFSVTTNPVAKWTSPYLWIRDRWWLSVDQGVLLWVLVIDTLLELFSYKLIIGSSILEHLVCVQRTGVSLVVFWMISLFHGSLGTVMRVRNVEMEPHWHVSKVRQLFNSYISCFARFAYVCFNKPRE